MKDDIEPQPNSGQLVPPVFPSIMLPMFLAVVDQTIVATALPAIAASLGSVERVSWVVVAYLVAGTIAAPGLRPAARRLRRQAHDVHCARHFPRRLAPVRRSVSVEMLALARVLQGLGGGGLMTLSQALIGETIPPRERARYQGYLAGVMVTSSTFGPVVGGYLTQHFGWRSVFLINLPFGLHRRAAHAAPRVPPRRAAALDLRRMGLGPVRRVHRAGPAGAGAGAAHERRAACRRSWR